MLLQSTKQKVHFIHPILYFRKYNVYDLNQLYIVKERFTNLTKTYLFEISSII